MNRFHQLLYSFKEHAQANIARSDILKPLAWLVALEFSGLVGILFARAPDWIISSFVISLLVTVVLYVLTYVYCLFTDKDALRSENYVLSKMAIEQKVFGDSLVGVIDQPESPKVIAAPSEKDKKIEDEA